jgi:predicted anti-sigma-YlaC factor YlaD
MPRNLRQFRDWIRQIYATQENELDCQAVFGIIHVYVDQELEGEDVVQRFPQVTEHLRQCPSCRDQHDALRDVALLERQAATQDVQISSEGGSLRVSTR